MLQTRTRTESLVLFWGLPFSLLRFLLKGLQRKLPARKNYNRIETTKKGQEPQFAPFHRIQKHVFMTKKTPKKKIKQKPTSLNRKLEPRASFHVSEEHRITACLAMTKNTSLIFRFCTVVLTYLSELLQCISWWLLTGFVVFLLR